MISFLLSAFIKPSLSFVNFESKNLIILHNLVYQERKQKIIQSLSAIVSQKAQTINSIELPFTIYSVEDSLEQYS